VTMFIVIFSANCICVIIFRGRNLLTVNLTMNANQILLANGVSAKKKEISDVN